MVLLWKRIKELRLERQLTQAELAKCVGVTTATITAYECDSRQPSYDVLIKLASTFRVTIDSLLLNRSESIIDVSKLNPAQIDKIQGLVDYFEKSELIDAFYSKEPIDFKRLIKKYPDIFDQEDEIVKQILSKKDD